MAGVNIQQAYEACEKNDKGLIASYAKRYPLAMVTLALIVNSGDEHTKDFLFGIPTTMSMSRIEKVMETGVKVEDISDDEDDSDDAPVKAQKADTEDKPKKRRGRPKKAEEPVETFVEDAEEEEEIEAIPEEDTEIMNAPETEDEEDEEESEIEEELEGYAAMNAVELFKLCKQRGINTTPKQKAAVYIELLEADDANNADSGSDDEDDEWDI